MTPTEKKGQTAAGAPLQNERDAAKLLLEEGIKVGDYHVKELTFGMLSEITSLRLQMKIDEDSILTNPVEAVNKTIDSNIRLAAKIAAIALIGRGRWTGKIKRRLFTGIYAWYLMERLKPSTIFELMEAITLMANPGPFMNSIRLASGIRMTAPMSPNLVETT